MRLETELTFAFVFTSFDRQQCSKVSIKFLLTPLYVFNGLTYENAERPEKAYNGLQRVRNDELQRPKATYNIDE